MHSAQHSLSRTLLCRSQCDRCYHAIRFLGVRCKHCRLKFHKKCSNNLSNDSTSCRNPAGTEKGNRVKRFWRRGYKRLHGKWPSKDNVPRTYYHGSRARKDYPPSWEITTQKYIDGRGKIRQKLVNGFYESLCYGPRQALEFQPATNPCKGSTSRTFTVDVERHDIPDREGAVDCAGPHETTSSRITGRDQLLASWLRESSWTSRSITATTSSGYSSANTSCPSSANSHRSASPTPDFSTRNIRLLSANLESCSLEEADFIEDEELIGLDFNPIATWPPRTKSNMASRNERRISSGRGRISKFQQECRQTNVYETETAKYNLSYYCTEFY